MKRIEGYEFNKLMQIYHISNTIMSEYLGCQRSTIITRRANGSHDFSNTHIEKLETLFQHGKSFEIYQFLNDICDEYYEPEPNHIDFVKESLQIHRKINKFENYLLKYRHIKNLENPAVILPINRHKHLRLIDILMENAMAVELLTNIIDAQPTYFKTSEKFLRRDIQITKAYILSVNINYMKELYPKLKKLEVNKLTKFNLMPVSINHDPMLNIDDLMKNMQPKQSSILFEDGSELENSRNEIEFLMEQECTLVDFVKKLSQFSKHLNAPIIMYLDQNDDEYDYILKSLDSVNRKRFKKVNIYKLNNMFSKTGNLYLSLEHALDLYHIEYSSQRLINEPQYKNIAINVLINKLMFIYGGKEEEMRYDLMNRLVHMTIRKPGEDKNQSVWTKFKEINKDIIKTKTLDNNAKQRKKTNMIKKCIQAEETKEISEMNSIRKMKSLKGGKNYE